MPTSAFLCVFETSSCPELGPAEAGNLLDAETSLGADLVDRRVFSVSETQSSDPHRSLRKDITIPER